MRKSKEKHTEVKDVETQEINKEETANTVDNEAQTSENTDSEEKASEISVEELLLQKQKEADEYLDRLRRTTADFDNFRKRTQKEKEALYDDGFSEGFKQLLPILDNLERALSMNTEDNNSLKEGIEMVLKMYKDIMTKMNIEEIETEGVDFNPDFHNAVMHIEDENYSENCIVEVLQKGYKFKDKVLRYSMVKVAN